MRRCFAALLLFAMPASAAISKVQQSLLVNVSGSSTCKPNLSSNTTIHDLLVVWVTWTPGNTVSVTSVIDSQPLNSFPSAVGPTLQSNASPQISAQIFYAKDIQPNTGGDNITVQFSRTATTASCVAVEYSGLDPSYPLDSVSAGSSISAGSYMDSGTAAPANANLLVFGAGTSDVTGSLTLSAGSNFTSIVANTKSITEQYINLTTSPNNTLQRANASTSAGTTGNWVMQMAVFRDTSWTVGGGWSPVRPYQVPDGTQFPGTDACARANTAFGQVINNVNSMIVDSRGEILGGQACLAPPASMTGAGGNAFAGNFVNGGAWYLPQGALQLSNPFVLYGKSEVWGACIGYDIFGCSELQALQSAWTGGLGGLFSSCNTGYPSTQTWNSTCHYWRGNLTKCDAAACTGTATWPVAHSSRLLA